MTMRLYDYALIYLPDPDNDDNEKPLLIDRGSVLAPSPGVANTMVARKIPEAYEHCLEFVEVAIRPF